MAGSGLFALAAADGLRLRLKAGAVQLAGLAAAALLGLVALLWLVYALHLWLLVHLEPAVAALLVGLTLLVVAAIVAGIAAMAARRARLRARLAMPSPATMALLPALTGGLGRHAGRLLLGALVAGAVIETLRSRR